LRPYFLLRAVLAPGSPGRATGGSSDFAHCSQSRQSHKAESSLCRGPRLDRCSTDYPFLSSCSPHSVARAQLLSSRGGKHRHRGTSTLLCTLLLKRTSAPLLRRSGAAGWVNVCFLPSQSGRCDSQSRAPAGLGVATSLRACARRPRGKKKEGRR
jgi:hypothetical protein